jgi:hypothetical protein
MPATSGPLLAMIYAGPPESPLQVSTPGWPAINSWPGLTQLQFVPEQSASTIVVLASRISTLNWLPCGPSAP